MRFVATLCALFLGTMAQAATLPAAPATAAAVLATAKACDVVQVSGASANPIVIGQWNTGPVLPTSTGCADGHPILDVTAAKVPYVFVQNTQHLTVRGGSFPGGDYHGCVYVSAFRDVFVDGVQCAAGVIARDGSGFKLTNGMMTGAAVQILGVRNFEVDGLQCWGAAADCLDIASSQHGKVHQVNCAGAAVQGQAHPDCVQVQVMAAYPAPTDDLEIYDSTCSGATQGFTAWNGVLGLRIHDNKCTISYIWAGEITGCMPSVISPGVGCALFNNAVSALPGSPYNASFYPTDNDPASRFYTPGLVRCGNAVADYTNVQTGQTWKGGIDGGKCPDNVYTLTHSTQPPGQ